jgi:transcriptional regulator with XRE-family HTH domain
MNNERRTLGARLREAREYFGLSQDEVAKVVGLPRAAISLIESGQRKVDALELKKFADLYQRPVGDFTGDVEVASPVQETVQHLARAAAKLTEADRAELVRFAEFLSSRTPAKREA